MAEHPNEWAWVEHWTDLLDQNEVWRDASGTILRLNDMAPGYCARVHAFCLRNAEPAMTMLLHSMAFGPAPNGDVATDCFNREWDHLDAASEDPQAWIQESDLLQALKHRAEGLPARPIVCHCGYPLKDDDGEPWDHSACHPGITVD